MKTPPLRTEPVVPPPEKQIRLNDDGTPFHAPPEEPEEQPRYGKGPSFAAGLAIRTAILGAL